MDGKPLTLEVKVLLIREQHGWTAQGLEYDIASQDNDVRGAVAKFMNAVRDQILLDISSGRNPLGAIPRAPDFYWEKFEQGWEAKNPETLVMEGLGGPTGNVPAMPLPSVPPTVRAEMRFS